MLDAGRHSGMPNSQRQLYEYHWNYVLIKCNFQQNRNPDTSLSMALNEGFPLKRTGYILYQLQKFSEEILRAVRICETWFSKSGVSSRPINNFLFVWWSRTLSLMEPPANNLAQKRTYKPFHDSDTISYTTLTTCSMCWCFRLNTRWTKENINYTKVSRIRNTV